MALIEAQDPMSFAAYQREFGNTICGQHPPGRGAAPDAAPGQGEARPQVRPLRAEQPLLHV